MIKSIEALRKAVKAMDTRRKDDLLDDLVQVVFDDFYDDQDRREAMIETIENISGVDICTDLRP